MRSHGALFPYLFVFRAKGFREYQKVVLSRSNISRSGNKRDILADILWFTHLLKYTPTFLYILVTLFWI